MPNETGQHELGVVLDRAAAATRVLPAVAPSVRGAALVAVADALEADADALVALAARETGLGESRLRGELRRTGVQLRLFAEVVIDGSYLDVRVDDADPDFALGARPDLRRYLAPLGVVLNFAASNFPFAFSVAGGDTAAALAAGAAVVVKVHPGHPQLSQRTAQIVARALTAAGLPASALQLIEGEQAGLVALADPRVAVASFTGSTHAGTLLARVAAQRPVPIPFYGELGSTNPVFVTAGAAQDADALAAGYVQSVSGSAGQLCTKPGFLFVPAASGVPQAVAERAGELSEHRLLHPGVAAAYQARREAVLEVEGVAVLAPGAVREGSDGVYATPTFVVTDLTRLREHRDELLDEAFGPLSILVRYDRSAELPEVVAELFPGNLTGTVQATKNDPEPVLPALLEVLARTSGRVIVNGWPTGVAVTPAMQHGGPFPATTLDSTSVGAAAIGRFLRGVAYQDVPEALLPEPLRDANPWNVPQRRAPAGDSLRWGDLTGLP